MKLITQPTVHVIGRQVVDQEALNAFLDAHGVTWESDSETGSEVLVEAAGRLCYMSFAKPRPGGNKAYIEHIHAVGHGSVTEHAVWNLLITGVSRSLTHELCRHRVGVAFSQLSQRYVDESDADFVVPPELRVEVECAEIGRRAQADCDYAYILNYCETHKITDSEFHKLADAGDLWLDSLRVSHKSYIELTSYLASKLEQKKSGLSKTDRRKVARQTARSVLPNATETKLALTVNARAARHFIELRGSRHADTEIRILAKCIYDALRKESPVLFSGYTETLLPDGTYEITKSS